MDDVSGRELDRLFRRAEKSGVDTSKQSEINRFLRRDGQIGNTRGFRLLSEKLENSRKTETYMRGDKEVQGYRTKAKKWTPEEEQRLLEHRKARWSLHKIAEFLGRSYDSTRRKNQMLRER